MLKLFYKFLLITTLSFGACSENTTTTPSESEKSKHIAKAMEKAEEYRKNLVEQSNIIVFGQVQSEGSEIYLDTIEYLKVPTKPQEDERLSLGEGVEPGRNIPSLNKMALVFFEEDMTVLNIYNASQGSSNYEIWRQQILSSKRNTK